MKRICAVILSLTLLALSVPQALASGVKRVSGKAYNVEVKSIDVVWNMSGTFKVVETFKSSGRKTNVNLVGFSYDYEEERPEAAGKFVEDQKVALVCVDGFEEALGEIADEKKVSITVDGEPIEADAATDYAEYIGWQNVHSGSYGVVFPIFLTQEGGRRSYTVVVRADSSTGWEIEERAEIEIDLKNERPVKEVRRARIVKIEGRHVEAYQVKDRIYLEYLDEPYYWIDDAEPSVEITFADGEGHSIEGAVWAAQTSCKADDPAGAALYRKAEGKLDGAKAVYAVRAGSDEAHRSHVVFHLETEGAIYQTQEYTLVERRNVRQKDPEGIYFAQDSISIAVGESYVPEVLAVCDGLPVRQGGTQILRLRTAADARGNVVEITQENAVIGTKPGIVYVEAELVTDAVLENDVGLILRKAYRSPALKIVVEEAAASADWRVACRRLHVRSGAGTQYGIVDRLERGDRVSVIAADGDWFELKDGGYVCAKYLAPA